MSSSIVQGIYRLFMLIQVVLISSGVHCAPKLGGIHFEQLLLETFMDEDNNTNNNYKREFTVPAYPTNIKNTTSLYAKLTGHSIRNLARLGSGLRNKEFKKIKDTTYETSNHSEMNQSTKLSKPATTSSISNFLALKSPISQAKINTSGHLLNLEKSNNKTVKLPQNVDLSKSTSKDKQLRGSKISKSRRDGAALQSNGYAFNGDNCKMSGDRVLCGYNNEELMTTETEPVDNDCILRNDRIECGYVNRIVGNNRRHNKEKSALKTGSEITNVGDNLTTHTNVTISSKTTQTIPPINSSENTTASFTSKIRDQAMLSKIESQELFYAVEKSVVSIITNSSTNSSTTNVVSYSPKIITNSSTSFTKGQPNLSRLIELIDRVEKILASADTTSKPSDPITASNKPITSLSTQEAMPSDDSNVARKSEIHASPLSLFNSTAVFITTEPTTTTSTSTVSASPTTTTTPVPYIDEGEYCYEKDGRVVCYDVIQEDYDGYLE